MGLRIWLPLNGNLENKGLDDIVVTNNGATIDNNGKIGKCYSFDGTNDYINITNVNYPNIFAGSFSICFWIYSDTDGSRDVYFGNYGLSGSSNWFNIEKNTNNELRFWWNNGSPNKYFTSYNILNSEGWTHVALTRFGDTIKVYKNGTLIESYTATLSNNIPTTATMFVIGGDSRHSGDLMLGGKMNDFRLYDEALSPMQIKLISQGLVAHYLLNNNGGGNNNLTLNSHNLNVTATKDNKNISNRGTSVVQLREDGFYETKVTGSWGGISIYANSLNLQVGDKITFSFYIYINGSSKAVSFYPMMYNSSGTRDTSSRLPISVDGGTYTTLNSKQIGQFNNTSPEKHYTVFEWNDAMKSILDNGGRIELSIQISGTWQNGDYVCLFAPKLEYGDKPTPWCPNSADSLATQLGYNTNIEYDVSGYCNNGTKYNITDYISNSPRYSVATKFNGTNSYINVGCGGMVKDEITINIWAYMEDWTTYNYRLISCTQSGGWNFEKSSDGIHFAIGTGATSNTYKNTTNYPLADLTSGWHMFTGSYDGFQNKMYIDGVLAAQNNSPYTTKTPIYYNSSTPVLIGAEANQTQSPAGSYFDGYMSDVRIYATALSESDLQSLYNNSGFLDSSGNIYATEYTES